MPPHADALRVAIAGCHRMVSAAPGGHNWASGFAEVPETRVVAVYDKGAGTRDEFRACWRDAWGDIPGYDDYDTMLEEVRPDIVCVATRQTYHADHIEAAVKAGVRGILCDKPLCTSLEEADRILAALREANAPLAYGLELRWSEQYQVLIKMLSDGAIGEVTAVLMSGVTELINHGCHWYDLALAMAGDAEPVWASGLVDDHDKFDDWRRGDPHGRGWVGLDNGVNLAIMSEGGRRAFTVLGTQGRLEILNEAAEAYLWVADPASGALSERPSRVDLPTSTEPWPRGPASIRDLVSAVRTGGKTMCDVPETRRATEIGFAIHASNALDGARVSIPVEDRTLRIDSRPWGNE